MSKTHPLKALLPQKAVAAMSIPPGRYRHYKGQVYVVLGLARHSETEEELVVYRTDYGDRSWWVRPLAMFSETVTTAEGTLPRFQYLGPDDAESV